MTFSQFIERIAWGAIAGIVLYAATQLKEMSQSITQLNGSMLVVIEKAKNQEQNQQEIKAILREYDERIDRLEKKSR